MEDLINAKEIEIGQLKKMKDILKEKLLSVNIERDELGKGLETQVNKNKQLENEKLDQIKEIEQIRTENDHLKNEIQSLTKKIQENEKDGSKTRFREEIMKYVKQIQVKITDLDSPIKKIKQILSQIDSQEPSNLPAHDHSTPAVLENGKSNGLTKIEGIITVSRPFEGKSIKCPRCGEQDYREQQDRTKIISYVPVQKFGKKYYCKRCRCEWRFT